MRKRKRKKFAVKNLVPSSAAGSTKEVRLVLNVEDSPTRLAGKLWFKNGGEWTRLLTSGKHVMIRVTETADRLLALRQGRRYKFKFAAKGNGKRKFKLSVESGGALVASQDYEVTGTVRRKIEFNL